MPIGISIEINAREILSIKSKKLAPKLNDAGIRILLSGPTIIRVICGMTNPIQPITPLTETAAEVSNVQPAIINNLTRDGFKPKDWASSSPIANKFICHLRAKSIAKPIMIGMRIMINLSIVTDAKLPINQYTISGNLSSGSATNFMAEINELKNADIATPDNTNINIPPAL